MNNEQITEKIMAHEGEISALWESGKSAHKRIDENDRIIEGIHKLAANVEALALQVKLSTEKVELSITRLEGGLKSQGERIGALEKEPGQKWKSLVAQITGLVVAAMVGAVLGVVLK